MPRPEKDRESRISQIVAKASTREWRNRNITFFVSRDAETTRRSKLPVLVPFSQDPHDPLYGVRYDCEGRIYHPAWLRTNRIVKGAIILGPVQRGRDYAENPPKTKQFVQLHFPDIRAGVDVALRRTETIRDKYRLNDPWPDQPLEESKEAMQLMAGLDLVARLRRQTRDLSKITEEDLLDFAQQNAEYLTKYGLNNPRSPDKKKIKEMLLRGFKDKTGKINPLAIFARIFSMEVSWLKRRDNAFPNILTRCTINADMLRFERDRARWALGRSLDELKVIAENPQLQDLSVISEKLSQVRVRPYLLGAYAAIIYLGTDFLPEETSMRKIKERKKAQGVLSVTDLLGEGNLAVAKAKLEFIIKFLQKILDLHADYRTVKASEERRKRLEQTIY